MKRWTTLDRRTILDHSEYLRVEAHTVALPDGRVIEDWPWVITPDYVNIVAVTPAGRFLCFRQTKYSVEGVSLAPMGGYIDAGEEPLPAAKRELLEESGYEAETWHFVGRFPVDGNRGVGVAYFFVARDARRVAARDADDLEEQELVLLSRDEVEAALDAGQFKLLPWLAAMATALRWLDAH